MLSQIALAALSILPIGKVLAAHPLLSPSLVFYFDQIPTEVYDDDPDVVAHKDVVYIRKDIHQLDPEDGPSLTCLPNGQVQLGYTNESALELNKLAYTQLLGHPVLIPHGYDDSKCPELTNHTIFGPKAYVPQEYLATLSNQTDEGLAIMIAMSEDEIVDNRLTLSVIWVTYHEIMGIVGSPPDSLYYLQKGVMPWDIVQSASSGSNYTGLPELKRKRGFGKTTGKIVGNALFSSLFGWALEKVGGK